MASKRKLLATTKKLASCLTPSRLFPEMRGMAPMTIITTASTPLIHATTVNSFMIKVFLRLE
jgi:hypothetical protein